MTEIARIRDRGQERADWAFARELCCRTARSGDPIDEARWAFFGSQWVGPYESHLPDWGYLAMVRGERAGYLTGCPDTLAFEEARTRGFDRELAERAAGQEFAPNSDTERFLRRFRGEERSPEQSFQAGLVEGLKREFPAHLHVNVDSRYRSEGLGARLMERFFEDLHKARIPGVHVFCGEKPVKFYLRNSFRELGRIEFGEARVPVFALGRKL